MIEGSLTQVGSGPVAASVGRRGLACLVQEPGPTRIFLLLGLGPDFSRGTRRSTDLKRLRLLLSE
jgi:hypothetical protein